jgi:hypothetical protein
MNLREKTIIWLGGYLQDEPNLRLSDETFLKILKSSAGSSDRLDDAALMDLARVVQQPSNFVKDCHDRYIKEQDNVSHLSPRVLA